MLHVLLSSRRRLRGDNGDIATCRCRLGDPGRDERAVDTPAAVGWRSRCAGEQCDPLCHVEARAANDHPVAQRDVAHDTCSPDVPLSSFDYLAWKVLVR